MQQIIDPTTLETNLKEAKLLIVEDSDDHWGLIRHALQQCLPSLSIHRVVTAQQALTQLHEWQYQDWEQPKLILLDLYLPERSIGLDLIEAIRALSAPLSHIPIVIYSASGHRDDVYKAYNRGASSYLIKPVRVEDWRSLFEQLRLFWWETAMLPRPGFTF